MRRRDFVKGIVGSATVGPLAAHAVQPEKPIVGMLDAGSAEGDADLLAGFRQALGEAGYVEGQNIAIEYRWAKGQYDVLPTLASELIQLRPAVLLAPGLPAALSIKKATSTIPIVFVSGPDPVRSGLVARASMDRTVISRV
jgi:putative ABC transport system substrate-binding protein